MSPATENLSGDIRLDEHLWRSSMLPQGVLERWLVADGANISVGTALAVVLIEDARHDLIATASGKLEVLAGNNTIVEPGAVVGRLTAGSACSPA